MFRVVLAEDSARLRREGVALRSCRACWCSPSAPRVEAEEAGKIQCVGVVLAVDAAAAGEGIALKLSGLSVVAQRPQGEAEEAGRAQCEDVVLAQDSAEAGEGVVLELPGLLIVTQRPQDQAEIDGREQGGASGPRRGLGGCG